MGREDEVPGVSGLFRTRVRRGLEGSTKGHPRKEQVPRPLLPQTESGGFVELSQTTEHSPVQLESAC